MRGPPGQGSRRAACVSNSLQGVLHGTGRIRDVLSQAGHRVAARQRKQSAQQQQYRHTTPNHMHLMRYKITDSEHAIAWPRIRTWMPRAFHCQPHRHMTAVMATADLAPDANYFNRRKRSRSMKRRWTALLAWRARKPDFQERMIMPAAGSVGKRAGSYVLATSNSSALLGGRRPSALPAK